MKILVTGDRGYIGTVLCGELLSQGYEVIGFDSGYFGENLLKSPKTSYEKITKDIYERINIFNERLGRRIVLGS